MIETEEYDLFSDEQTKLEVALSRLSQNLEIVREDNLEKCPFCGAYVLVPTLEKGINEIKGEIESIREKKAEIDRKRQNYENMRKGLRVAFKEWKETGEILESKQRELGVKI